MPDIHDRINGLVTNFVMELTRLAREAAVNSLKGALTEGTPSSRATIARPPAPSNGKSRRAVAARTKGTKIMSGQSGS